jgi:hypothetical protein
MKCLPNDGGILAEEPEYFGARMFLKEALRRFPQLAEEPDVEIGIHISMAALGRLTVAALRAGEANLAYAVVQFLEGVLEQPHLHPEVRNAVAISFVDAAEIGTFQAGRDFLDSVPPAVRHLLR